jgi:hypothetical protein
MKHLIAVAAALALLTSPVMAGNSHHSSNKHHSQGSKGSKKGGKDHGSDKGSKGDDSNNPFSSLMKTLGNIKPPHN